MEYEINAYINNQYQTVYVEFGFATDTIIKDSGAHELVIADWWIERISNVDDTTVSGADAESAVMSLLVEGDVIDFIMENLV